MKPLFLLIFFNFSLVFGQTTFRHTFGGENHDHGRSVKQTFGGGYIVAGSTSSFGNGNSDVYIIKLDSLGIKQWSRVYGGPNVDWGFSVVQSSDSNFVICGYTNSYGAGGYDVYLLKIDTGGNFLWQKTFGGADWDFGYSLQNTSDGGFVISGETYSYGSGNNDVYLIKTNSFGDTLWTKTYGGIEKDYGKSVKQTFDGGYILAGGTNSFGAGLTDVYIIKTDGNGDTVWTKTFGGDSVDYANSVSQAPLDSGFIMVGTSFSFNSGNSDYYLMKTDFNGVEMWSHPFNTFANDDYESDVISLPDGRYAMFGASKSVGSLGYDYQFMITDQTGWVIIGIGGIFGSFNYDEISASFDLTSDGGFILCGSSPGYGEGYNDVFLVKLDSQGHADSSNVVSYGDSAILSINMDTEKGTFNPSMDIFPNPVTNISKLNIGNYRVEKTDSIRIRIFDVSGRQVKYYSGTPGNFLIHSTEFVPGFYFVNMSFRENNCNKKILVIGNH